MNHATVNSTLQCVLKAKAHISLHKCAGLTEPALLAKCAYSYDEKGKTDPA